MTSTGTVFDIGYQRYTERREVTGGQPAASPGVEDQQSLLGREGVLTGRWLLQGLAGPGCSPGGWWPGQWRGLGIGRPGIGIRT